MAACGGKVRTCPSLVHHIYSSCLHLKSTLLPLPLQVVVAGGINFETDLDDVWVADVPDTRAVHAAAAAAAAIALQSNVSDDQ